MRRAAVTRGKMEGDGRHRESELGCGKIVCKIQLYSSCKKVEPCVSTATDKSCNEKSIYRECVLQHRTGLSLPHSQAISTLVIDHLQYATGEGEAWPGHRQ